MSGRATGDIFTATEGPSRQATHNNGLEISDSGLSFVHFETRVRRQPRLLLAFLSWLGIAVSRQRSYCARQRTDPTTRLSDSAQANSYPQCGHVLPRCSVRIAFRQQCVCRASLDCMGSGWSVIAHCRQRSTANVKY